MTRFTRNYAGSTTRARRSGHQQPGQAIVELALSLTVITMFLGAAVDLGLAFKSYQTLVNATAEASNYLVLKPSVVCSTVSLPGSDGMHCADTIARQRFQTEQGDTIRGSASTLDLNADGNVDDASLVRDWVQIDEADSTQVTPSGSTFAVGGSFNPNNTALECKARNSSPSSVSACYIVIRSKMLYKPFVLQPFLGDDMTIATVSVYQVK